MLAVARFFCRAHGNAKNRDNDRMNRFVKLSIAIVLALVLLLAAVAGALKHWVGSDDFRGRIAQQVSQSLGLPVELGHVSVNLWPLPAVALEQVQVKSQPPLTLELIEARPVWAGLLRGHLGVATLIVRNAVVPEQAVDAINAARRKQRAGKAGKDEGAGGLAVIPRRIVLDNITWVHAKGGESTVLDLRAQLDDDNLPASVQLAILKGRMEGAKAKLQRESDHWNLNADLGGGTVTGKLQLRPGTKGGSMLQGEFDTAKVEVAALTAPSRTLTGRLEAHTTLQAEVGELGALAEALQTQTRFTVHGAVVHGIDLAKAVKSVGMNRGGETHLDTLAGNVTSHGRSVQLSNLVATSGALSANGTVAMAPDKSLNGQLNVNLAAAAVGGAIGVPLAVGGTLDSPNVTLSRGALIGAAIGTVLAPGVGTAAGAGLGGKLGSGLKGLFGK
ncbi:MAG: hypothetical protein JWQ07_2174 [Ramlibacter sp.]|nr:hypothetical protein [Ramlibacter sp.]